jgi:hypothetical protein
MATMTVQQAAWALVLTIAILCVVARMVFHGRR